MNPTLPDLAVEFASTAEKAIVAAGGTELARRAEVDDRVRTTEVAQLLVGLGLDDLDPRTDPDTAAAAAELCRVAGRYALPYPVAAAVLRDGSGRPLAVDGDGHRVDHANLFPEWRLAGLGQSAVTVHPVGHRMGTKLGPFVGALEPATASAGDGPATVDDLDVALHLTLGAWRILGAVERAIDLAVAHVRDRHQFGQALAQFQAVQFQLADAAVGADGLRELARFTLWRVLSEPSARRVDPLALRLHAIDVARTALRTCQQLFGAAGLCDEYDVSILVRHIQPELRLPFGAEQTASRLFDAVARDGFDALFAQGGRPAVGS
ncbi:MAG TPA: acyl-CoA dehydrogenase family protein [Acidimicrobiales bacterium]|nr:acyl-CoA dehydrogenase family protein [Acidimicrobiales bacterium]